MSHRRAGRARMLPLVITALTAVAGMAVPAALGSAAGAETTALCNSQKASVGGGTYIVQNNEWNSSASECVTTDGNADFAVANSAISNATSGAPGGYPSIYQGCHWGNCSSGGLAATPVQASSLGIGKVTTSWSTTQTGSGAYDVAYDIWFNRTSATTGQPNCMELMVWLNHNGGVQPFGSEVATNVSIGGHSYNVWEGAQSSWNTVSYTMTTGTTSVSNLDVGQLAQDAISRGYMPSSCWLIDVEAGFELWQGGAGLATTSFSVKASGGGGSSSRCTATYATVNSWPGGFQAQVTVTAGASGLSGWSVGWTFPGDQKITDLWNASYTQSGQNVTTGNLSYNGTLAAGASTTFGFTGSYTSNNAAPASLSCT
ncbi:MAG: cellulose binding domain-containing protein [Solirubrobacterales bacterium]|nr:cellulose binding domain-containing protein [Solirubrobacterales bacterium]